MHHTPYVWNHDQRPQSYLRQIKQNGMGGFSSDAFPYSGSFASENRIVWSYLYISSGHFRTSL